MVDATTTAYMHLIAHFTLIFMYVCPPFIVISLLHLTVSMLCGLFDLSLVGLEHRRKTFGVN